MCGCRALRKPGRRGCAFWKSHFNLARHVLPFMEMAALEKNGFVWVQCVGRTCKGGIQKMRKETVN